MSVYQVFRHTWLNLVARFKVYSNTWYWTSFFKKDQRRPKIDSIYNTIFVTYFAWSILNRFWGSIQKMLFMYLRTGCTHHQSTRGAMDIKWELGKNRVFRWKFEGNFFHFFQCGPRDLSLSLMRPASHSEFETPG